MSMTRTKKLTFNGTSTINDVVCERFSASIESDNPENLSLNFIIADKNGYRDNRKQCRKDQAQFEDEVYAAQAQLLGTEETV